MKLKPNEFIRRFLLHTLPDGFHRIRHFGFMANRHRAAKLALCRTLLDHERKAPNNAEPSPLDSALHTRAEVPACPDCGAMPYSGSCLGGNEINNDFSEPCRLSESRQPPRFDLE